MGRVVLFGVVRRTETTAVKALGEIGGFSPADASQTYVHVFAPPCTAAAPFLATPSPQSVLVSCLFHRLVRRPHNNLLSALAIDDVQESMPILLPMADGDLHSFFWNEAVTVYDKLR